MVGIVTGCYYIAIVIFTDQSGGAKYNPGIRT